MKATVIPANTAAPKIAAFKTAVFPLRGFGFFVAPSFIYSSADYAARRGVARGRRKCLATKIKNYCEIWLKKI
jgi:hypothetical protein